MSRDADARPARCRATSVGAVAGQEEQRAVRGLAFPQPVSVGSGQERDRRAGDGGEGVGAGELHLRLAAAPVELRRDGFSAACPVDRCDCGCRRLLAAAYGGEGIGDCLAERAELGELAAIR